MKKPLLFVLGLFAMTWAFTACDLGYGSVDEPDPNKPQERPPVLDPGNFQPDTLLYPADLEVQFPGQKNG